MTFPRFELRGVSRRFPRRDGRPGTVAALEGVSLVLADGEATSLCGPTGAGKSTLARLLLGLEQADEGEVLHWGRPLAGWPRRGFLRRNQMVFQNPHLAVNPGFRAERIAAEPLRIAGMDRREALRLAGEALEAVGLPPECRPRYPAELSAGQLQRVTLARALVLEPSFLVLDEPFSCLDEIAIARLQELLAGLRKERRLGMLLVCHNPRHAAQLASRHLRLEAGRLEAGGSP